MILRFNGLDRRALVVLQLLLFVGLIIALPVLISGCAGVITNQAQKNLEKESRTPLGAYYDVVSWWAAEEASVLNGENTPEARQRLQDLEALEETHLIVFQNTYNDYIQSFGEYQQAVQAAKTAGETAPDPPADLQLKQQAVADGINAAMQAARALGYQAE